MDAARHNRICGIFERVIALPEEQRTALLERSCAGDASLRAEVDSLIAAHQRTNPILDAGALALLTEPEDEEHPDLTGQRIGRYELKRVIARGGMGIVYEAMQEEPRRIVAVKVLRRLGSPSAVRRFHEEAQILARLNHPHIAHVYEAGTHIDGSPRGDCEHLPFFAMEFISEARPLTEFAIERRLPIRERLLLFIKVCEAVQHGHQKGIIHRDLKPANILVNADGVPKVIDFGVARVLEFDGESRTRHTLAGRVIGTLPYCSPEQIDESAGDIDSRSDVYALGAVLYELLAGVPAFKTDGCSTWQTMTMIRESSPRPLRELDRGLRGNLDAIVSRAMEKHPDRRYQSVESLRRDIERHLAGEPIEARPQSRWIGATRWMGRHPLPVSIVASAAVAAIVLGTSAGLTWYNNHRPFEFWVSPDGRIAHLVTRFNRTLATLGGKSAEPGSVTATIIDRPQRFGGGRLGLFTVRQGANSTEQQLWMCRLDDLSTPVWETKQGDPAQHPPVPESWNASFEVAGYVVTDFFTANVFPDTPEEEIVAIHEGISSSPNAIRVYDFSGDVLFEAWHFGHIARTRWWSSESLLICVADRHGIKDIEQHGYVNPPPWPRVVFAIRPMRGERVFAWLNERDWPEEWRSSAALGNTLAWYKALSPREWAAEPFGPGPIEISRSSGAARLDVRFEQGRDGPGFVLYLNARGEVIGSDSNDAFRQERQTFPSDPPTLVEWSPPPEGN